MSAAVTVYRFGVCIKPKKIGRSIVCLQGKRGTKIMKPHDINFPPFLQAGDTIGICATARKVSPAELELAIRTIESWGLYVALGKNLYSEAHQYSGTDEQRASDLQDLLDDPDIKAVISARGGYGTM